MFRNGGRRNRLAWRVLIKRAGMEMKLNLGSSAKATRMAANRASATAQQIQARLAHSYRVFAGMCGEQKGFEIRSSAEKIAGREGRSRLRRPDRLVNGSGSGRKRTTGDPTTLAPIASALGQIPIPELPSLASTAIADTAMIVRKKDKHRSGEWLTGLDSLDRTQRIASARRDQQTAGPHSEERGYK